MRASELRLPALAGELFAARRYVEAAAIEFGLDVEDSYDFVYAANEAITNAIRHGAPNRDGQIVLSIHASDDLLSLSIHDCGRFATPERPMQAGLEGGRGFALMARLVDDIKLHTGPGGTTVTLCKVRV